MYSMPSIHTTGVLANPMAHPASIPATMHSLGLHLCWTMTALFRHMQVLTLSGNYQGVKLLRVEVEKILLIYHLTMEIGQFNALLHSKGSYRYNPTSRLSHLSTIIGENLTSSFSSFTFDPKSLHSFISSQLTTVTIPKRPVWSPL